MKVSGAPPSAMPARDLGRPMISAARAFCRAGAVGTRRSPSRSSRPPIPRRSGPRCSRRAKRPPWSFAADSRAKAASRAASVSVKAGRADPSAKEGPATPQRAAAVVLRQLWRQSPLTSSKPAHNQSTGRPCRFSATPGGPDDRRRGGLPGVPGAARVTRTAAGSSVPGVAFIAASTKFFEACAASRAKHRGAARVHRRSRCPAPAPAPQGAPSARHFDAGASPVGSACAAGRAARRNQVERDGGNPPRDRVGNGSRT